jgi:hypothetical protein
VQTRIDAVARDTLRVGVIHEQLVEGLVEAPGERSLHLLCHCALLAVARSVPPEDHSAVIEAAVPNDVADAELNRSVASKPARIGELREAALTLPQRGETAHQLSLRVTARRIPPPNRIEAHANGAVRKVKRRRKIGC